MRMPGADAGRILSITAGYIPSGIAYGALATAVHVPWYVTIILSVVVYSGAVQSAFVGFWSIGFEPFSLIITAFLLNLRHTFYGPHLEEVHKGLRERDIAEIGPFLTDEVYAIAVSKPVMGVPRIKFYAVFAYLCWFSGSAIGVALVGGIPSYVLPILFLALPALFLGLMVPKIEGSATGAAAATSVLVSVFFRVYGLPAYFLLISILAGVVVGLAISWSRRM